MFYLFIRPSKYEPIEIVSHNKCEICHLEAYCLNAMSLFLDDTTYSLDKINNFNELCFIAIVTPW